MVPSPPGVAALFIGFFTIGARGFGGVLPWAHRAIVEERKWLTATEFGEVLGLCQFLPGGNIMNVSIAVGARFRGAPGAVAAFLGLMAAPVAVVVALGAVYDQYAEHPVVRRAFAGLAAAASAFVLAASLKIAAPLRGRWLAIALTAVTFVATAVFRVPLQLAMPVLAVLSILVLWRFET
ncbi:MAG: chromate transporter [Acetobacteraceae bacterium]|nr:chromate transporter [Acetobacteraceae bacterium]